MPRECATCAPIAKTSLITGLILVGLGAVDSPLQFDLRWVAQVFLGATLAGFVGLSAGFWGLISGPGGAFAESDRFYIVVTLLNVALCVPAVLAMLL
ncbi:MAG: hypothetical protein MUO76_14725 [Anaerolineaceae bacterium]|nr:hypothetical protein [Anaerolineaceae bacterium]